MVGSGLQRLTVRDGETEVVQTHPVLVEPVLGRRDWAKPQQTGAEAIDHPAVEERQLLTCLLVGVGGHLEGDGQPEHVFVEGVGTVDVGHS